MSFIAAGLNILAMLSGFRFLGISQTMLTQALDAAGSEQKLSQAEFNAAVQFIHFIGQSLIFLSVVSIILAAIALIFLYKNIRTKAAGWLLVAAGIVSLPELIIPGLLYLIAGIMALLRRPPVSDV